MKNGLSPIFHHFIRFSILFIITFFVRFKHFELPQVITAGHVAPIIIPTISLFISPPLIVCAKLHFSHCQFLVGLDNFSYIFYY